MSSLIVPTHLVNHIRHHTLNLIRVLHLLAAKAYSSNKLDDGNASAPHPRTALDLGLLEPTGKKDLAQEVAQRNVAASLQGQVDATLDELVLALLESQVECVQLTLLDAVGERQEKLLEAGIRLEKLLARERVGCE